MISNQILQSTIDGLKNITRTDLCVCDTEGKLLATTFPEADQYESSIITFVSSPADSQVVNGFQYFKIFDENQLEYVLLAQGNNGNDDVYMIGKMVAYQIESLLVAYKERFDKDNFIKNLILDNFLKVDVYNRAKKLHIDANARRAVLIVVTDAERDNNALEIIRALFASRVEDFVTAVDEHEVIIVKEIKDTKEGNVALEELDKTAKLVLEELENNGIEGAKVAYGTVMNEINDVCKAYNEAKMALEVGQIFYSQQSIMAYAKLGIGRLIYQLPLSLCKMFIGEIFEEKNPNEFDEETLTTINKFFENSLNVSETSRQLYIHRNTLVYRLDKLQKTTGLDLRVFEDAITFKIALMVVKYMNHKKKQEF